MYHVRVCRKLNNNNYWWSHNEKHQEQTGTFIGTNAMGEFETYNQMTRDGNDFVVFKLIEKPSTVIKRLI